MAQIIAQDPPAILWAADLRYPSPQALGNALGGAPDPQYSARWGPAVTGASLFSTVGGTPEQNQLDGRKTARLGVGLVNEQLFFAPAAPRLAKPLANAYVDPDTLMHWWEADVRFRTPGASRLSIWAGLRKASAAQTNQWSTDDPALVGGIGIGVSFNGAGTALVLRTKRTFATDATMTAPLNPVVLPGGFGVTDWMRWGFIILAATASRAATFQLWLNNLLQFETVWNDDGTGAANNLPDYTDGSNTALFAFSAVARSDLVANVLVDVADLRFRMGRYNTQGVELSAA